MGKTTGFIEFSRESYSTQSVKERLTHYREFTKSLNDVALAKQGARCMDCGTPFCHSERAQRGGIWAGAAVHLPATTPPPDPSLTLGMTIATEIGAVPPTRFKKSFESKLPMG